MSSGSFDAKERIKQEVDIVDLVGSYIQLRRQGRNYVGLCPWHDDTRPSLQVNPERQSFKCWVCDIGGDVFSFVMKIEGVEFREALEMLAERTGIELEKPRRKIPAQGKAESESADVPPDKRTLLQAAAWAERQYHRCLLDSPEAEPARKYLEQRGITPQSVERFRLGFCPLERDWILRGVEGIVEPKRIERRKQLLEAVGILARSPEGGILYDRFRGRLLFSIHDPQGRPVGIGGRLLPEAEGDSPISATRKSVQSPSRAKYVNSPETMLFTKSKLLYGLDLAREELRKTRTALVMEGYTDVIMAHQFGFTNAVAVLGTALGESHVRLLKHHADQIILVLDGDEAGTRRANEVLELFVAQQTDLRILTLPEGLDPCDFLRQRGAEAFSEHIETRAVDALDHAFATKTRDIDLDRDVHGASRALEEMISIIARSPRLRSDTTGEARFREEKILQRIAARFRVDERDVRRRLTALRRSQSAKPQPAVAPEKDDAKPQAAIDPWERELLELIVARPECMARARERVAPERFQSPLCREIFETCCRLDDEGTVPAFDRLMLQFDRPELKNLLVDLDETGQSKGRQTADAETLLDELTRTMNRKEAERQRPAHIVTLREGGLDIRQQATMLEEIIRRKREQK
ncbi:MAG: DNA primase [Pirellulales bacterium]|nr:DNA primase [Pirellulales bacterium]